MQPAEPVAVAHHEVGHVGGEPGGVEGQVGPVRRGGRRSSCAQPAEDRRAGRGVFHRLRCRPTPGHAPRTGAVTRMPWHGIRDLGWLPCPSTTPTPAPPAPATPPSRPSASSPRPSRSSRTPAASSTTSTAVTGMADLALGEAVGCCGDAGHAELADRHRHRPRRAQHPRRALDVPGRRGVRRRLLRGVPGARAGRPRGADGGQAARVRGGDEAGPAHPRPPRARGHAGGQRARHDRLAGAPARSAPRPTPSLGSLGAAAGDLRATSAPT